MKFSCSGLDLSDAVLKVVRAAAVRTTNPILECVKLSAEDDKLTLTCTDLELTIIKTIKADVKIEGEAVIPAKFFSEFARMISSEQITFTMRDNNTFEILYGSNTATLQCQNAEEFPQPKELEAPEKIVIRSNNFKDLVTKASVAVAQDDSRPMLKGILLEINGNELNGVALDGVRMALIKKQIESATAEFGIIVSARSLLEIIKLLPEKNNEITILTQKNHLMINLDDTILITRLLGHRADFVSYQQIIPNEFSTSITVNKQHLSDTIERASLLNRIERNHIINLNIKDETMVITSQSELGNITEHLQIVHTGNDLKIDFNGRFITDALHVINEQFVKINFGGSMSPCIITGNDTNEYLYLILPMRV